MSSEPLPPPPAETALSLFLRRAAPLVAQERGMTARAHVLLEALAGDLAISPLDYQEALAILQRGEAAGPSAANSNRTQFNQLIAAQFAELPAKILSARQEHKLVSFAITRLGLSDDAAHDAIKLAAAEQGIKRVPLEQALNYVEEVVAQLIGDQEIEPSDAVPRLHAIGRDWGFEPADVDELIQYRLEENAARKAREKLWTKGLLGGGIAAVALTIIALLWIAARNLASVPTPEQESETTTPIAPAEPRRNKLPAWWDTDLTLAIASLKNERPDFAPLHQAIMSPEAERRRQGYDLLLDRAARKPFDLRAWRPYEGVISGCYSLEPDESAANALLTHWLAVISSVVERVPDSPADYQAATAPLDLAIRTIKDHRTPPARSQSLASAVGSILRISLDVSQGEAKLQNQSLGAISELLMERLPDDVEHHPEVLVRHWPALVAMSKERVDPSRVLRHQANLVAAAIEHAPSSWSGWQSLIEPAIQVREPLSLLRLIDAWERAKLKDLRDHIKPLLLARAEVNPAGIPESQLGATMRKALGYEGLAETSDLRWAKLEESAAAIQKRVNDKSLDDAARLRLSVEFAWHVNLAMALGSSHPNPGLFDTWLAAGPFPAATDDRPSADDPFRAGPGESPTGRLNRDQQETFDRYLHDLGEHKRLAEPQRVSYLRSIANLSDRAGDINQLQARNLASYVLAAKSGDELTAVYDSLPSLRVWRYFRLAVADGLERSELEPPQIARVVLLLSGSEVSGEQDARPEARRAILRSVVSELSSATGTAREAAASEVDRNATQLGRLYRERARLLGLSAAEVEAVANPSDVLMLIAKRIAPKSPIALSDEYAARLALVANFARNEPQRVVLLQRMLIEDAVRDVSRRKPDLAHEAAAVAEANVRRSVLAKDALTQIQDNEATWLALCLLLK